jgi:SpoVK/Ycf46/Vps4 family AAA+-type ATPase
MRRNNIPLKRAVLVEGPYGTGKSESGRLTAKEAVENGWSFILCRPNRDNLNEVLQTAQLYAPAVVWYEDLDVIGQGHSDQQISRLLDSLDGITAKGVEVLAGFTTNHVDKLQKGVLRPGRLDAVIHVGGLDEAGYEKLVRVTVPEELLGDVDFSTVAVSFKDFLPAFAKEAIDRSMRYAISRNQGSPAPINTEDLVAAADGLRPQLELMNDAQEGVKRSPLEERFSGLFTQALNETRVLDDDGTGDVAYLLKHNDENE